MAGLASARGNRHRGHQAGARKTNSQTLIVLTAAFPFHWSYWSLQQRSIGAGCKATRDGLRTRVSQAVSLVESSRKATINQMKIKLSRCDA
jgi:hypothetical protein